METCVIVSPDGHGPQHCVNSSVSFVTQSTSSCPLQQSVDDQNSHHYQEIGTQLRSSQAVVPGTTTGCSIQCCCSGQSGGGPMTNVRVMPFNPPPPPPPTSQHHHHRHQHSIPESDSGSIHAPRMHRNIDMTRSCRGPILSSSTENVQSGGESQYGRRKKRWVTDCFSMKRRKINLVNISVIYERSRGTMTFTIPDQRMLSPCNPSPVGMCQHHQRRILTK